MTMIYLGLYVMVLIQFPSGVLPLRTHLCYQSSNMCERDYSKMNCIKKMIFITSTTVYHNPTPCDGGNDCVVDHGLTIDDDSSYVHELHRRCSSQTSCNMSYVSPITDSSVKINFRCIEQSGFDPCVERTTNFTSDFTMLLSGNLEQYSSCSCKVDPKVGYIKRIQALDIRLKHDTADRCPRNRITLARIMGKDEPVELASYNCSNTPIYNKTVSEKIDEPLKATVDWEQSPPPEMIWIEFNLEKKSHVTVSCREPQTARSASSLPETNLNNGHGNKDDEESSSSTLITVAIVTSLLLISALLVILAVVLYRRKMRGRKVVRHSGENTYQLREETPSTSNPAPPHGVNNVGYNIHNNIVRGIDTTSSLQTDGSDTGEYYSEITGGTASREYYEVVDQQTGNEFTATGGHSKFSPVSAYSHIQNPMLRNPFDDYSHINVPSSGPVTDTYSHVDPRDFPGEDKLPQGLVDSTADTHDTYNRLNGLIDSPGLINDDYDHLQGTRHIAK